MAAHTNCLFVQGGKMSMRKTQIIIAMILMVFYCACGNRIPASESAALESPASDINADVPPQDSSPSIEPVTIRLATCGSGILDYGLIADFAADNAGCTVEVVDYYAASDYDYEKALQKLITEIMGGNGPDIIDLSSFSLNLAQYADKCVLEDLYPWLDRDPELDKSEFVDSVFSLCEHEDGLYAIMSGFSIKTMYGAKSLADSVGAWNLEKFYDYKNALGSAALDEGSSFTLNGKVFLEQLCATSITSFIDYENTSAYFDSEEFIELLNCCKQMQETILQEPLLRIDSVMNFFEIQYQQFCLGEELCYLGIPGLQDGDACSYINNQNNYLAMNAQSAHKEAAWDFMRRCLTKAYQTEKYVERASSNAFPTNLAALDAMIEISRKPVYYIDENGNEIEMTSRGMYEFIYAPADDEEIGKIMSLINSVSGMQSYDPVITEIVLSEADAFFASDKTAEEAAQIIQSKIMLYLGEIA